MKLSIASTLLIGLAALTEGSDFNLPCVHRSVEDFLDAQGTKGSTFFMYAQDIVGWVDGGFVFFCIADYAGVWNEDAKQHGHDFETEVKGTILECPNNDGTTAEIRLNLRAKDALIFSQLTEDLAANGFDFEGTATIFGKKLSDVIDHGEEATLGKTHLKLRYTHTPGSNFADMLDIINNPAAFAPMDIDIKFYAQEDQDGDKICLKASQVGSIHGGETSVIWTNEEITIEACEN